MANVNSLFKVPLSTCKQSFLVNLFSIQGQLATEGCSGAHHSTFDQNLLPTIVYPTKTCCPPLYIRPKLVAYHSTWDKNVLPIMHIWTNLFCPPEHLGTKLVACKSIRDQNNCPPKHMWPTFVACISTCEQIGLPTIAHAILENWDWICASFNNTVWCNKYWKSKDILQRSLWPN